MRKSITQSCDAVMALGGHSNEFYDSAERVFTYGYVSAAGKRAQPAGRIAPYSR